jgi:hypothetical protein
MKSFPARGWSLAGLSERRPAVPSVRAEAAEPVWVSAPDLGGEPVAAQALVRAVLTALDEGAVRFCRSDRKFSILQYREPSAGDVRAVMPSFASQG